MAELLVAMIGALLAGLRPRASLVAENLALRRARGQEHRGQVHAEGARWTAPPAVADLGSVHT